MMRDEVLADGLDDVSVLTRAMERGERRPGDVLGQAELPPGWTIDEFRVIGVEQDHRERAGREDLEVLGRENLEPAKKRALRHDVDPPLAHRRNDVRIRNGWFYLDAQLPEPVVVDAECLLQLALRRRGRRPVPPGAHKADAVDLASDSLECGKKIGAELAPAPPVVTEVDDVEALGRCR